MIKESVKAHGKHQLEIKQKVLFDRHAKEIRYRIDTWFFLPSALQINPDFYTTGDFRESKVNQLMVQNSHGLVIVVADYRKIGVTSNFQVAGIQKIDILITDTYGDPARLKEIEEAGVTVIQIDEAN